MAVIRNEARLALRSQGKYLLNKRHSPIRENARLNKKAHFSRLITKPAFVCLRKPNGKKLAQVYLGRVYYLSILIFKQPPLALGWLKNIPDSVTRLGAIWKLLAINFLTKIAQIFGDLLVITWNEKLQLILFWQLLETSGLFFIPIPSHTDPRDQRHFQGRQLSSELPYVRLLLKTYVKEDGAKKRSTYKLWKERRNT